MVRRWVLAVFVAGACGPAEGDRHPVEFHGDWTYLERIPEGEGGSWYGPATARYAPGPGGDLCVYGVGRSFRLDPDGQGEFITQHVSCDEENLEVYPLSWGVDSSDVIRVEVTEPETVILVTSDLDVDCVDDVPDLICHDGGSRWTRPVCDLAEDCGAGEVCIGRLCLTPEPYERP